MRTATPIKEAVVPVNKCPSWAHEGGAVVEVVVVVGPALKITVVAVALALNVTEQPTGWRELATVVLATTLWT